MLIPCTPGLGTARAAPLALGTSATTFSPAIPRAKATSSAVSAICGSRLAGTNAADLDLAHPGRGLGRDPALLGLQRHDRLDRLQPVTRADFGDEDVAHGSGGFLCCGVAARLGRS
jgi:hypothetical protein